MNKQSLPIVKKILFCLKISVKNYVCVILKPNGCCMRKARFEVRDCMKMLRFKVCNCMKKVRFEALFGGLGWRISHAAVQKGRREMEKGNAF